jgi:hypothetical protein
MSVCVCVAAVDEMLVIGHSIMDTATAKIVMMMMMMMMMMMIMIGMKRLSMEWRSTD